MEMHFVLASKGSQPKGKLKRSEKEFFNNNKLKFDEQFEAIKLGYDKDFFYKFCVDAALIQKYQSDPAVKDILEDLNKAGRRVDISTTVSFDPNRVDDFVIAINSDGKKDHIPSEVIKKS